MSDTRYKVVFNGELVPGADLNTTKEALANLFKSDLSKIEQLFSSPNVAIKRDLSEAEAQKYVDVLARAGIQTRAEVELASTLSLIKTEEHDKLASSKRMTCPKCQTEQVESEACSSCGIVVEKYLARQEQLKAAASAPAEASPFRAPQADVLTYDGEFGPLNYFTIQGRIGRLRWIAWSLVLSCALFLIPSLALLINNTLGIILMIPAVIAAIVIGVFMGGQRLHDIGWSAWLLLIFFVPLIGGISSLAVPLIGGIFSLVASLIGGLFSLVMLFAPGTRGHNQYGPPPPPNSTSVIVLSGLYIALTVISILAAIALPALFLGR